MARATVPKVREVVDELPALQCDLCDFVFSVMVADVHGRLDSESPIYPVGAGQMVRATDKSVERYAHSAGFPGERRDLCPTCMQAIWDEVTARREKLLSDRAKTSSAAPTE